MIVDRWNINMYSTACCLELGLWLKLIFFLHLVTVLRFEAPLKVLHKQETIAGQVADVLCEFRAPSTLRQGNLKTEVSLALKTHEMFPIHTTPEKFKNATFHQSFWIFV